MKRTNYLSKARVLYLLSVSLIKTFWLFSGCFLVARVYDMPTSAILINGKRANYYKVITSLEYRDCTEAVKRIAPRIDMITISNLIDEVEQLNDLQKEFLKQILKLRKEFILDAAIKHN